MLILRWAWYFEITLLLFHLPDQSGAEPITLSVSLGGKVIMLCKVSLTDVSQINWKKEGLLFFSYFNNTTFQTTTDERWRFAPTQLEITDVRQSDEGSYTCAVTLLSGVYSREWRLRIEEQSGAEPITLSVSLGGRVIMLCNVSLTDVTQITWRKEGLLFFGYYNNNTFQTTTDERWRLTPTQLEITDVRQSDEGNYTCAVTTTSTEFYIEWRLQIEGVKTTNKALLESEVFLSVLRGAIFISVLVFVHCVIKKCSGVLLCAHGQR
nr:PREDICTED: junctional adhesion molecule-like isoform X2 [Lepisosteus oculatus]